MVTLKWCKDQNRGISLIQPNDNLCAEYLASAEETLTLLKDIEKKSRMWLATTKYYCEYFAVYALLMKIGVKSEIHDCTIALCELLESNHVIPKGTSRTLERDKNLRIDNQYYLKNREVPFDYDEMVEFIIQMRQSIQSLTYDKIHSMRELVKRS